MSDLIGARQFVLLGRSLLVAILSGALSTALGVAVGYAISLEARDRQQAAVLIMLLPLLIPPFVHSLALIMLCDRFGVACHGLLPTVGVLGISFFPLAGLLTWAGRRRAAPNQSEAGLIACGPIRTFVSIDLAALRPQLVTSFLLISLFSFSDYAVPSLFRVITYPVHVFSQFAVHYDVQRAAISTWPYLLLPILATSIWKLMLGGRGFTGGASEATASRRRIKTRSARMVYGLAISVPVGIPVIGLALTAGAPGNYLAAWSGGARQMLYSLLLAVVSATVITILALPRVLSPKPQSGRLKATSDFLSLVPIALPGTIFGLGIILLWNRPATTWIYGSSVALGLLYAARFLPFGIRPLVIGRGQVQPGVLDMVRLSDAGRWVTAGRILLPLLSPSILVGWVLCFVLVLRELTGTLLVIPPGQETLAVRIYSLYHYGAGAAVAALSLLLLCVSAFVFGVATLAYRGLRKC
ncbi:MAG: iron ABC transporter permease [Verrucomicrobia bacterium]|nr:iron ABC transporter permease [Verrucomicrobiota bacterium]MBT7699160.1 iron ABC transporter permease [Verrucomicrobiota bacterium]